MTDVGPSIPAAWRQRGPNEGGQPEIPAATVVLVRDGRDSLEVLLLKRAGTTSFAADAWVFPGGRVEPSDADDGDVFSIVAARRAAARETEEEAGIILDSGDLQAFAHWTPGPEAPKRFATWTLFGPVGPETEVRIDGGEIVDHQWISPSRALDEHRLGRIAMLPPTWMTLLRLSSYPSVVAARAEVAEAPIERFSSRVATTAACRVVLWSGDAGYQTLDADAPGARHRLYLDDRGWRYERIVDTD
ncbi:NUDIX hydrolase [Mycolicibacterium fluoranthenivorans]|uniref:NUDIX hydrolase n=1 Tax=Mycolicibacterium fluoranthenivorans TaxID=258505 RepID=UPI0038B3B956